MNSQKCTSHPHLQHETRRTRLHRVMKSVMVVGVLVGTNGWLSANAIAALPNCGAPPKSKMVEPAVQLWQDCSNDSWNLTVAGVGDRTQRLYQGSIEGAQPVSEVNRQVVNALLEPDDTLDISDPSRIRFQLRVANYGEDSFTFAFPSGTPVCVKVTAPSARLLVGPDRTPVTAPVDLRTLGPCGHAYLDDADRTDSVDSPADSDLGQQPFPRITTGPLKRQGTAEQFSKYGMIAVKARWFGWLKDVQAINPQTKGLRIHSAFAYQGAFEEDCGQAAGMPFSTTGPATVGCAVYAGHWLYAPGSVLRSAITASTRTIPVVDATRFNAGRYIVIYDGGPGAFVNAEHVRVTAVNIANNMLSLGERGYRSTAQPHPTGAVVAEHVIGNGDGVEPKLWTYNQSTACPRDASGRQLNAVMAEWLAENYQEDPRGNPSRVKLEGILFDSDFHFLQQSDQGELPDVNNDLVLDNGLSPSGENLWGAGLETFYDLLRERLPNAVLVGGVTESRGYGSLNGTQLEGWPRRFPFMSASPDYPEIGGRLSAYSMQMHHGRVGPRYAEGSNKMPTKLYPSKADPNPTDNSGFRFGFGLILLDDGYYGQQNWHVLDPWWDEYAVDVVPGSTTYGQAIASTPVNESLIRSHAGWMGFPSGPRYRIYDPAAFAPERNLLTNGGFDTDLSGWSGVNVTLTPDTAADNRLDGRAALRIGEHSCYANGLTGAAAVGPKVHLTAGVQYTLAFGVRASAPRMIQVAVAEQTEAFTIPDTWSRQVFTFTAARTGDFPVRFNVGRESSPVWVDSVYLFEGNADVFRRDFDHAVVIVNATPNARTVDLGSTLQRIKGTGQDPINDGATITEVTLAAHDSIVLVRP